MKKAIRIWIKYPFTTKRSDFTTKYVKFTTKLPEIPTKLNFQEKIPKNHLRIVFGDVIFLLITHEAVLTQHPPLHR
ncbi:hypothetical protein GCM10011384_41930 [Psychrobacillus lasiicapitis]|nr:hypothetical protein GCM10011384_41930 [Psychrobacillus lasiicapitis]